MSCMCTKSKIGKGRVKIKIFPPTKVPGKYSETGKGGFLMPKENLKLFAIIIYLVYGGFLR